MAHTNHKLFLVSGPSASGKTTVMRSFMKNEVTSVTTRNIRTGEVEGVDYHFISVEEYMRMKENGELAEFVSYESNHYGITKGEIERKLERGHAFVVVEFGGMKQLKELYPDSVTIFIYAPTPDLAQTRMEKRGDASPSIQSRVKKYTEEMGNKGHYDYVVKNIEGQFEETVEIVRKIVEAETKICGKGV